MFLSNKSIIITGASKGIGRSLALLAAEQGASLLLLARDEEKLASLASEIRAKGSSCITVAGDVSEEDTASICFEQAIKAFGKVDALINNAGIGIFKPVEDLSIEEWDNIMGVNVRGTFLMSKAALPHMKGRKEGKIINIASDVSKRTFPTGSLYCASKYAQHGFADAMRKEVLDYGIQVSTIYPGQVDTYFGGSTPGSEERAEHMKAEDIAQAVLYILQAPKHVVIDEITLHPTVQRWWS